MNSRRAKSRYFRFEAVALLLIAGVCLYAFSGLPRPWSRASESAYDIATYQRMSFLGKVIGSIPEGPTDGEVIKRVLAANGVVFKDGEGSFENVRLRVLDPPTVYGQLVLVAQEKDRNGMVWAVTHGGEVVKVRP